jgi:hypothetical protein
VTGPRSLPHRDCTSTKSKRSSGVRHTGAPKAGPRARARDGKRRQTLGLLVLRNKPNMRGERRTQNASHGPFGDPPASSSSTRNGSSLRCKIGQVQICQLRSRVGGHFTKAGAGKLGRCTEHNLRRALISRSPGRSPGFGRAASALSGTTAPIPAHFPHRRLRPAPYDVRRLLRCLDRSQNSIGPGVRLRKRQHGHEGADKGDRNLDSTFRLAPNSGDSIIDGYRYSV